MQITELSMRSLAINQLLAVMLRPIPNVSFNFPITTSLVIDPGKPKRMFHVPFLTANLEHTIKKRTTNMSTSLDAMSHLGQTCIFPQNIRILSKFLSKIIKIKINTNHKNHTSSRVMALTVHEEHFCTPCRRQEKRLGDTEIRRYQEGQTPTPYCVPKGGVRKIFLENIRHPAPDGEFLTC